MSETWLKNNPHLLNYVTIPGYSNIFRNRDDIRGGGVGVYLKDAIDFKRRTDIENIEPELEHIWLEIPGRNKHSKLLLGVMYRSERMQNFETWMDKTENLFSQLNTLWDGLTVITGDFNVDLLRPECPQVKRYTDMLESLNLHQHVERPTRITSKSKTMIVTLFLTNLPVLHTAMFYLAQPLVITTRRLFVLTLELPDFNRGLSLFDTIFSGIFLHSHLISYIVPMILMINWKFSARYLNHVWTNMHRFVGQK